MNAGVSPIANTIIWPCIHEKSLFFIGFIRACAIKLENEFRFALQQNSELYYQVAYHSAKFGEDRLRTATGTSRMVNSKIPMLCTVNPEMLVAIKFDEFVLKTILVPENLAFLVGKFL
jgi:hypothetical protein